jgi:uncharacterized membrane protein
MKTKTLNEIKLFFWIMMALLCVCLTPITGWFVNASEKINPWSYIGDKIYDLQENLNK